VSARTAYQLAEGGSILIEQVSPTGVSEAGRPHLQRAASSLCTSLGPVVAAASDVIAAFSALPAGPEEVEIQFGVELDASAGAVLVSGRTGAHFEVTLRWRPHPASQPAAQAPAAAGATTATAPDA
jgi:hypothetical protein